MHQDKFKTGAANEAYRDGWDNIFKKKEEPKFEDVDQEVLDAEFEEEDKE